MSTTSPSRPYLQVLADVLISPGDAFAELAERPRLLVVLALMVAVHLGFTAIWLSHADLAEMMRQQLLSQGREAPPADKLPIGLVRNMAWAGAVVGLPLVLLVVGGVMHFAFTFLLGAELRFKTTLSVVAHAFMPAGLLGGPLALVVMWLKGEWNAPPDQALQSSLAAFLDPASVPKAVHTLAGSFELFSLWTVALLSVGFGVATRRGIGSGAGMVVGLWLLYVLGKAALAAIF